MHLEVLAELILKVRIVGLWPAPGAAGAHCGPAWPACAPAGSRRGSSISARRRRGSAEPAARARGPRTDAARQHPRQPARRLADLSAAAVDAADHAQLANEVGLGARNAAKASAPSASHSSASITRRQSARSMPSAALRAAEKSSTQVKCATRAPQARRSRACRRSSRCRARPSRPPTVARCEAALDARDSLRAIITRAIAVMGGSRPPARVAVRDGPVKIVSHAR